MLKHVVHIFLAIAVFLSSAGFLVNEHFCQDRYVGTSFIFDMGSCECTSTCCSASTEDSNIPQKSSCSHNKDKKKCCHTESSFAKIDQTQQINKCEVQTLEQKIVWHTPNFGFQFFAQDQTYNDLITFHYSPPLIVFDLQVQLETFQC